MANEEVFATRDQIDCHLRTVEDGTADKGSVSLCGFARAAFQDRATQILARCSISASRYAKARYSR